MDGLEPHWAVTNPGQFVDGKIKDPGGFTIRYCNGCSVGLCEECVDMEARRVYTRVCKIQARAAFFGLCKRAWQLNERMLDIEEPERWPQHVPSAQEILKIRDNRIRTLIFALRQQAGHRDEEDFGEEDEARCCTWCHVPLTPQHHLLECDLCEDRSSALLCLSVCLREHILSAHAGAVIASAGAESAGAGIRVQESGVVDSLVRQAKEAARERNRSFHKHAETTNGIEQMLGGLHLCDCTCVPKQLTS